MIEVSEKWFSSMPLYVRLALEIPLHSDLCACEAARRTIGYCRVCVKCFAASPDPKRSSLSSFIYTSQH